MAVEHSQALIPSVVRYIDAATDQQKPHNESCSELLPEKESPACYAEHRGEKGEHSEFRDRVDVDESEPHEV